MKLSFHLGVKFSLNWRGWRRAKAGPSVAERWVSEEEAARQFALMRALLARAREEDLRRAKALEVNPERLSLP
jgi:hypothetical protein